MKNKKLRLVLLSEILALLAVVGTGYIGLTKDKKPQSVKTYGLQERDTPIARTKIIYS